MDGISFLKSLNLEVFCQRDEEIATLLSNTVSGKVGRYKSFHFASADVVVRASKDRSLLQCLRNSYVFCDSRPLFVFMKIRDRAKKKLVQSRGTAFMSYVWSGKGDETFKHFLISPNEEASKRLITKFNIAGQIGRAHV